MATFNTGSFGISRFDSVVSTAKKYGIRLVVALTNNWSDYGGMDVYVSQLNPGGTHDTFYTNAKIISAYENYISNFVGRYKTEPTIMAWELANEPRCSGSTGSASSACDTTGSTIAAWAKTISAYIKSIDPNHLVAIGDEGWFQEANPPTYPYAPGVGVNFVTNLQISTLDFGTFHSYPEVSTICLRISYRSDLNFYLRAGARLRMNPHGVSSGLLIMPLRRKTLISPLFLASAFPSLQ